MADPTGVDPPPPLPLARARARLLRREAQLRPTPRKKMGRPPKDTPVTVPKRQGRHAAPLSADLIIGMTAAGVSQARIADALDVTKKAVEYALHRDPQATERIATLREQLKDLKMQRAHQVEGRLWGRLEREVDSGEARDVDAVARALLASEKIQAAASGEAHASGSAPPPPSNVDLKALIQILVGG